MLFFFFAVSGDKQPWADGVNADHTEDVPYSNSKKEEEEKKPLLEEARAGEDNVPASSEEQQQQQEQQEPQEGDEGKKWLGPKKTPSACALRSGMF